MRNVHLQKPLIYDIASFETQTDHATSNFLDVLVFTSPPKYYDLSLLN